MKKLTEKAALWIALILSVLYGAALCLLPCYKLAEVGKINGHQTELGCYTLPALLKERPNILLVMQAAVAAALLVTGLLSLIRRENKNLRIYFCISSDAVIVPFLTIGAEILKAGYHYYYHIPVIYIAADRGWIMSLYFAVVIWLLLAVSRTLMNWHNKQQISPRTEGDQT